MRGFRWSVAAALITVCAWGAARTALAAAEVKILLPLGRAAYQTNERIDLAVVRSAPEPLAAGALTVSLAGDDGSRLSLEFPAPPAAVAGPDARRTEHLHLDGRLLRPGRYALTVACDGATASAALEVFSHVRRTTFRLIDWVPRDAQPPVQQMMGEDGQGFNLFWGGYAPWSENLIRGGMDYMRCCTMGGGHQVDLRQECDWSDPYVLGGAVARVTRQAFADRTKSNAVGVHFYDEPGLTWSKDPQTGQMTPNTIPSQLRAFRAAFGRDRIPYGDVSLARPETQAEWKSWGRWHVGFLDAAWKLARFGVEYARPDFLSANQSMYAWYAFGDGYYFNVQRSMPVIGGHGGYDEWGNGFLHPGLFMAMGRVRELAKPVWYMPTWGRQTSDRLRMQQYLSFMQNLQGMMVAPPTNTGKPWAEPAMDGVVESNLLMGRLGTVFTTMPVTRPPVAVLYSLSQNLHVQARLMGKPHDEAGPGHYGQFQTDQFRSLYAACCMTQMPFFPVVEEDVLDGTLATHHKVLILPKIDSLDAKVVAGLEAFIASGGTVLMSDDSTLAIKGAKKLGVAIPAVETKPTEIPAHLKACEPLAAALKARMKEAGIPPVFACDNPAIAAWRQAWGDVEYLFAVNAACDAEKGGYNPIRPAVATIGLPDDGRPVYDAVLGAAAAEFKAKDKTLAAAMRFGAGQMRVFARTARPIGGVQVASPTVRCDYTVAGAPMSVEFAATVVDSEKRTLAGAIPLEVRVVDPLGAVRYALWRATDGGVLKLSLPLAANDAAGRWKVSVRELLSGSEGTAALEFKPPAQCGAVAGADARAITFGNDRENVFRFFRLHKDVTIVKGAGEYNTAAAERLAKTLQPWGVRAKIVSAEEAAKPHAVPEEAQPTWCGLSDGRPDWMRPSPDRMGFAIDGPAVLLGTPEDNMVIKFLRDQKFLPYAPDKADFPGRGRGMVAWQADGIGYGNQESVTLIAYDEAGMAEAVGTVYEAAIGMDPLMKWEPPSMASITPPSIPPKEMQPCSVAPEPKEAWRLALPDRAVAMRPVGKDRFVILTKDGTLAAIDAGGKVLWRQEIEGGEAWVMDAAEDGSVIAVGASHHLAAFNGGDGKRLFDVPLRFRQPGVEGKVVSPATAAVVSPDGKKIVAGMANGAMMLLDAKGKAAWSVGGLSDADYEKWKAAAEEWKAGAENRAAEMAEFKTAAEKWKADVAAWGKADPKTRGQKPAQPQRPRQPGQPQLPRAKPYGSGLFSLDGKTLLAVSQQGADLIDAADGKVLASVAGVASRPPAGVGDAFLVTFADGVGLLSSTDGKSVGRVALPKATVVAAAPYGQGAVVALAEGGRLAIFNAINPPGAAPSCDAGQPGRMVKKIVAGERIAAASWGGFVQIVAGRGTVAYARRMPQDIADMVWLGGRLVVGLADGRVVALDSK